MDFSPNTNALDTALDEAETQQLQAALEQLAKKNLPDEAQTFLLAELYIQYGQNAKAIAQLEFLLCAKGQVNVTIERQGAVEIKLQEAKLNFENAKEKLPELLDKIKLLYSYDPCGQNGCPPSQRAVWSAARNAWICVGC